MKYIIERKSYLILDKITWLDTKKRTWDPDFSTLILSFHDVIEDTIAELKDKFNDRDDPDEIMKFYIENLDHAFDSLIDEIRNITDGDLLHKLWYEMVLNISLWKDSFRKMSEKLDNYNSIFKLGYEIFSKINIYITKSVSSTYYDGLIGELDDKRENSIKFIEKFHKEIKDRLIDIDPVDVFSISNLNEKDVSELILTAGDEVRYYQHDDVENIAIISYNQNELEENDNVRLISKKNGHQFEIDKNKLIEIIPKHKSKNQEIGDKLIKIKSDPDKMDKINDLLDDLLDDDEEV